MNDSQFTEFQKDSILGNTKKVDVLEEVQLSAHQCVQDANTVVQSSLKRRAYFTDNELVSVERELREYIEEYYQAHPDVDVRDLKSEATKFASDRIRTIIAAQNARIKSRQMMIIAFALGALLLLLLIYMLFVPKRVNDYALSCQSTDSGMRITSPVDDRKITIEYAPAALIDTEYAKNVQMKKGEAIVEALIPGTSYIFRVKDSKGAINSSVELVTAPASASRYDVFANLYISEIVDGKAGNVDGWIAADYQAMQLDPATIIHADSMYVLAVSDADARGIELDPENEIILALSCAGGKCVVSQSFAVGDVCMDAYTLAFPMNALSERICQMSSAWTNGSASAYAYCMDELLFHTEIAIELTESEVNT